MRRCNEQATASGITYRTAYVKICRSKRTNDQESRMKEQDSKFFFKQYTFIHQIQMFDITEFLSFALLQGASCRRVQQIAQIAFYLTSHSQTLYCNLIL